MSRKVNVATIALNNKCAGTVEGNREMVLDLLKQVCHQGPDIVCLPESFPALGISGNPSELAESVPGPTTDMFAAVARRERTNIVCPIYRKEDERVFTCAVILNREGEVAGIYDKMYLANISWGAFKNNRPFEFGSLPGKEAPVFELDFGKIGVQICFDLGFQEGWAKLAEGGAELVFWPSAFNGGLHLRAQAFLHNFYVVSSVGTAHSYVINPIGEVLAKTGNAYPLAVETIDLDYIVCYFDWHLQRIKELKETYGDRVSVRVAQEEGLILFEASGEDLSISEIKSKVLLESSRSFHQRHAEQLHRIRAGRSQ